MQIIALNIITIQANSGDETSALAELTWCILDVAWKKFPSTSYILLPILLMRRLFFDISFEIQNSPQAINPLLLLMHKYLYVIPPVFFEIT